MYRVLTSFENDYPDPTSCSIKGTIPVWIQGSLIRNGSGLFHFGSDIFKHLFDGMAVLHKYTMRNSSVSYQNRLIESESYKKNRSANRIVATELGTVGIPDPNESLFTRFFSHYFGVLTNVTDNTPVTVVMINNRLFAMTETPHITEINPSDLQTMQAIDLKNYISINMATAHMMEDGDGSYWNIGTSFLYPAKYLILKIPAKICQKSDNPFMAEEVFSTIPARWSLEPSYYHSFGMSENYIVLVEQTVCVPILKMATATLRRRPLIEMFNSYENEQCLFHVINKQTGRLITLKFCSKSFFVFHHVNTFEDCGHLVVDLCAYEDSGCRVMSQFKLDEIQISSEKKDSQGTINIPQPRFWRFVLPLDPHNSFTENLVTLNYTSATSIKQQDGSIFCSPETFIDFVLELPRINPNFVSKKYRYCYGLKIVDTKLELAQLVKYDVEKKQTKSYIKESYIAGEPVFIPRPDATEEDDGVVLSPMISMLEDLPSFLLFLDGQSFTEIGRAEIPSDIKVPYTFHGIFV